MMVTIDLKYVLICLVLLALLVFLVLGCVMVAKLFASVKNIDRITTDLSAISKITAERAEDLNQIVIDLQGAVSGVTAGMKKNRDKIKAVGGLASAAASMADFVKRFKRSKN